MKSNYRNYFKDGNCYQWDKDNTVYTITKANVNQELDFCLDKFGMDMLLKFNNPNINLKNNKLEIEADGIKANIPTISEALLVPKFTRNGKTFKVDVETLSGASQFLSVKDKRLILQGVNIQNGRVNATDSFIAFSKDFEIDPAINITIPKSFIEELKNYTKGEVEFRTDGIKISALVNDVEIIGVLLEGQYPSLLRIFEGSLKATHETVQMDREELNSILSYVLESKGTVTLDKNIVIQGEFANISKNWSTDMKGLNVSLQLSYFKAALNYLNSDITMSISSSDRPIILNDEILITPLVNKQ